MSLSEKSRTEIYQGLQPLVGEEAIGEMLSHFPASAVDELATKDFVRAEIAELRVDLHRELRLMLTWMMGTILGAAGLVIAAVSALD